MNKTQKFVTIGQTLGIVPAKTTDEEVLVVGENLDNGNGVFSITAEMLDSFVANFDRRGAPISVTLGHPKGDESRGDKEALGWIRALRRVGDALVATVEWLRSGAERIGGGRFLFKSAEFTESGQDQQGNPIGPELFGLAVTNDPFLHQLEPLALNRRRQPMATQELGRLAEIAATKGTTLDALAASTGIDAGALGAIDMGTAMASDEQMATLAVALELTPEELAAAMAPPPAPAEAAPTPPAPPAPPAALEDRKGKPVKEPTTDSSQELVREREARQALEARIIELEKRDKTREQELHRTRMLADNSRAKAAIEAAIREGRITPAEVDGYAAEPDAAAETFPAIQALDAGGWSGIDGFARNLAKRPKAAVPLHVVGHDGGDAETPTDDPSEELRKKTHELIATAATEGKTLSYDAAYARARRENPDLRRRLAAWRRTGAARHAEGGLKHG